MARSHPRSSDEDLACTMTSATSKSTRKKYISQIECTDLENEAKTTRTVTNLSVNFVDATSCQLFRYSTQAVNRQPGFRLKDL